MQINFNIKPNKLQQELIEAYNDDSIEFVVTVASRQIGKSIGSEILMLMSLFTYGNQFNAWISPTFRQAKKVYRDLCRLIPNKYFLIKNGSELILTLHNGNTIQFFSGESIESMRGFTMRGLLIIDECAFFPNTDWLTEVVLPTLKNSKKKKLFLISTPNGKDGVFYEYYLKAKSNQPKFKLIEKNIYEDELISNEKINELKSITPSLIFSQEYECKFLDNAITVFNNFETRFIQTNYDESKKQWFGIDLSTVGSDNTVLTFINELNQTKQYIIKGNTLDDKYNKLAELINNNKNLIKGYIEINSIGEPIYNELFKLVNNKSLLLPFTTTNESKNNIINLLALQIDNNNITFEKDNNILFSELGTYTFSISKSTRKIIYNAKQNCHDDTVMSLAFALRAKEDYKITNTIHFVRRNK